MNKDDAQLINRSLNGEVVAFGQLVERYQNRLYNTVAHTIGCPDEAEDVVQEAFIQAYTKLSTFQQKSAFYTWLYRIAFNIAISRQRRKRPTASIEHYQEVSGQEPQDSGDRPGDSLDRQERAVRIRHALDRLSEQHRSILVLREVEGFCYETISEILDLPIGTVRSRLHRARAQMREQLEEVFEGNPTDDLAG